MPWIKFKRDYPWSPVRGQTILYKEGMQQLVPQACALGAIQAGAAEAVTRPEDAPPVPKAAPSSRRRKVKANGNQNPEPGQA